MWYFIVTVLSTVVYNVKCDSARTFLLCSKSCSLIYLDCLPTKCSVSTALNSLTAAEADSGLAREMSNRHLLSVRHYLVRELEHDEYD